MKISEDTNLAYSNCSDSFEYNYKQNLNLSKLNKFTFELSFLQLNLKAISTLKILEAYGQGTKLIKFEIFKKAIKISSLSFDIFMDIKLPLENSISNLEDTEYFQFVIDSEKFLRFISILNSGNIIFEVSLSEQSLILHYKDLTLNLVLESPVEFLDYEKYLNNIELISNEFHCENIKHGLDFCNLIFSKQEETSKMKQIQLSNNLIFSHTLTIGSSAVFYENFGNVEYTINHNLIKVFSQILPLFNGIETKIYKTTKHTIFKDSTILLGIPSPINSSIDLKPQMETVCFQMNNISKFSLNRKDLIQSLTALSIFLKDLQDDNVTLTFSKDTFKLSVIDQVTSKESFDKYSVEYAGKEISISLKFDSILKNLKFFANRELVDIEILELKNKVHGLRVVEEHNSVKYSSFFIDSEANNIL